MPPTHQQRSVLLVEDDRNLRELYRASLRNAGYEVGAVEDGTDALHRLEHWTPDVVVLDLILPRLGGRDLLLELKARQETRGVPVVIVTGTEAGDVKETDSVKVLHKPVPPDELVTAVDAAVRGIRRVTPEGRT